ncbi:AAC(3) family N-acetyltransferase [Francisella sp. 19X1-34]|uniref:AAC(3) family N-acetyltransferase n=1 Tax=Francisella sp. 19X1-34 TaxID=3087177 RepID=UPI002E334529|nr:AAC(3) family N-acetyltransferase [Francisella sp. 19X1-34]MED7787520.1 AAC(3) family N-acetyltransferase [Francisella sp. 19X1-34]
MRKFSIKEFSNSFCKLGLKKGDVVLIHNSLLNFGIPMDCQIGEISSRIFNELRSTVGAEGTIVVPTFNFDFCKGVAFNKQESPSKGMGVFSEFVRNLPDAKRSTHPMQSVSAIGPQADFIVENDTGSSFSPGGAFDRIRELNGKVLLLGADFNSVSMIHWVEEKYEVPYRYWKAFKGLYLDESISSEKSYLMFARSLKVNPILKLYGIEENLKKVNKLQELPVGNGWLKVFNVNEFIEVAEYLIKQNPYYFVSNHPNYGRTL